MRTCSTKAEGVIAASFAKLREKVRRLTPTASASCSMLSGSRRCSVTWRSTFATMVSSFGPTAR